MDALGIGNPKCSLVLPGAWGAMKRVLKGLLKGDYSIIPSFPTQH